MLGALLGDFVGTAELGDYSAEAQREIRLHWKVDSYTDRHPAVVEVKALFPEGRRRFAGIVLDVYFDHLLARDWPRFCDEPLDTLTRRFYDHLLAQPVLPERLRRIAPHMARHDWLGAYRDRASVDKTLGGIATRLSRHGDKLLDCVPVLRAHEPAAAQAFDVFFPELRAYVEQLRAESLRARPASA